MKIKSLLDQTLSHESPVRYFVSRLFVNFPTAFRSFYFKRNGYKLSYSASSLTAEMFVKGSDFLSYDELIINRILRPGDAFVDIGANIGHLSISAKINCDASTVISIEANPKTYEVLKQNIHLNNLEINCENCALSDLNEGVIEFQDSVSDDCNSVVSDSMRTGAAKRNNLYVVESSSSIEVPRRTLDSIVKKYLTASTIRLIKIDVEGYELFVIEGGTETLMRTEIIYFEYWDRLTQKYDYDKDELFEALEKLGFSIFKLPVQIAGTTVNLRRLERVTRNSTFTSSIDLLAISNRLLSAEESI